MFRSSLIAVALASAAPSGVAAQAPEPVAVQAPPGESRSVRTAEGWVRADRAPVASTPAQPAAAVPATEAPGLVAITAALKPGDFHWQADAPAEGPVLIAVSIPDQKLYAYRSGRLFAVSTVSTGKRGHSTPRGAFPIMEKHREHYSNLYNNAPMPFMQRLTSDGIALHAGKLPGYPASHGCIRLPLAFAKQLFGVTQRGSMVVVTDQPLTETAALGVPFDTHTGQPVAPAVASKAAPANVIPVSAAAPTPDLVAMIGAWFSRFARQLNG